METDRLLLRTWRLEDAERLDEIYAQPEYLEHMPKASAAGHIADYQRLWEEDGFSMTFDGTAVWHGREHVWYSLDREQGS